MSVKTIIPSTSFIHKETPFIGEIPVNLSSFWKSRSVQASFCGLTTADASRLSLRLFGAGAIGTAVTVTTMAVFGTVTWPVGLLAIPCLLSATGAIWYSTSFDDYENPEELERFRRDAERMSLEQVSHSHGWTNMLQWGILPPDTFLQKYRQHLQGKDLIAIINYYEKVTECFSRVSRLRYEYQIPSPREWRGQWRQETATKSFEEIIKTYPIEKLEKYNILEVGELQRLKELKRDYDAISKNLEQQISIVEREFQTNTSGFKLTYDIACAQADRLYNDNWAVKQLQTLEMRYVRERQAIQDQLISRKNQAQNRFDQAVASMTNHGRIPYEQLQPPVKIIYDRHRLQFNLEESQAENEARAQISSIDQRCVNERIQLNGEEARVRNDRQQMISQAKIQYDNAVALHQTRKQERVRPLELSFQGSVNDLNHRYRSYLRTVGIN